MNSPLRFYLHSDEQSPSHFKTYLQNPIELQGSWKVALENITYSSNLKTRPATVKIDVIPAEEKPIWMKHPFHYRISKDDCWIGNVQPPDFKQPLTKLKDVIETLNAINNFILHDDEKRKVFGNVFRFSLDDATGHVIYECFDADFTLRITAEMAKVLGFDYLTIFSGDKKRKAENSYTSKNLTADDFSMVYFNKKLQFCEKRIVIKHRGQRVKNENDFLATWKRTVETYANIKASFQGEEKRKLVIRCHDWGTYFTTSPEFAQTFCYYSTFISNEQWAWHIPNWQKDNTHEEWYIDIYGMRMAFENDVPKQHMTIDLYPWQCKTLTEVVRRINHKVNTHLKQVLKTNYSEKQHAFKLNIAASKQVSPSHPTIPKDYASLFLGQRLEVTFSESVSKLFAFPHPHFKRSHNISNQKVGSKYFEHEESILVLCNLAEEPISRFVHQRTDDVFVDKWFNEPRMFPIKESIIPAITCELQDTNGKRLDINERPTMITLKCCKDD